MCTAVHFHGERPLFGRNLDLHFHYDEQVVITPRYYPLQLRSGETMTHHHAMIGMATVKNGYPLYYDACNEWGLAMAGLNFPGNAAYLPPQEKGSNITPFEMIPWILAKCKTVSDARQQLTDVRMIGVPYSRDFSLTPLHFILADKEQSIVLEPMEDGLKIYDNPVGVLTNNPPFPWHLQNLCNYRGIGAWDSANRFAPDLSLDAYSNGMGALGLPGDYSSASRFVKAAYLKWNTDKADISHFFHILDAVAMPMGSVRMPDGAKEITQYSCCMDTTRGIYYYTTYENRRITAVAMQKEHRDRQDLLTYSLLKMQDILIQNSTEERL